MYIFIVLLTAEVIYLAPARQCNKLEIGDPLKYTAKDELPPLYFS